MRLTRLKLAGFKTFVDPTTIVSSSQLVGVVGPNGCGKSNVIDAVRWVLGESRAGALRGESMEDVIFNGSVSRKPVGRASVEMHFDNSLGRAAGQWSQFGEITVKRVLERSGTSSYHINNLRVRRRDVIDLFLGTGLGPRAYAIIEQGMISRIIEARPEDVRAFLEEAAGVTKYKDRRRETEGRLGDARENLARLEDIRGELGQQLGRLEVQASVAERYQGLQHELGRRQQLFWWLKRSEAAAEAARLALEFGECEVALQAAMAQLRSVEGQLEIVRQTHLAAGDAVHRAQSDLFEVNAELARLETEQRHLNDARERAKNRCDVLGAEASQWSERNTQAEQDALALAGQLDAIALNGTALEEKLEVASGCALDQEAVFEAAKAAHDGLRRQLAEAEQQVKVEQTRQQAAQRALETLLQRRERLKASGLGENPAPEAGALAALGEAVQLLEARHETLAEAAAMAQAQIESLQASLRAAQQDEKAHARRAGETRARCNALGQLQNKLGRGGKLEEWLCRHGLDDAGALWRHLQVEPGWETAVEALLRERLRAVVWNDGTLPKDQPQQTTALALPTKGSPLASPRAGKLTALAKYLNCTSDSWRAPLGCWLAGAYAVDDLAAVLAFRHELAAGELIVDRSGRVLDRGGVLLHAPDATSHGLLERQREIEALMALATDHESELQAAQAKLTKAEADLDAARHAATGLRGQAGGVQQQLHEQKMAQFKLEQAIQRFEERQSQLLRDMAEVDALIVAEEHHLAETARALEAGEAIVEHVFATYEAAAATFQHSEARLREVRAFVQSLERELQETRFGERTISQKLEEADRTRTLAGAQLERIATERATIQQELSEQDETALLTRIENVLSIRQQREQGMQQRRNALEEAVAQLKALEEARLRTEQTLHPARERLSQLRLAEQAATLSATQFAARLTEACADEAALQATATAGGELKESTLQRDIGRLNRQIDELGPVNLAALEELGKARERARYLAAQANDLATAIGTLEEAIRRIDRETRTQLAGTYEAVNRQFGQLFPELFGGGEARLVLTGDEILDSGIQIIARPPGKKNSSIHLLSGGEKALTAIALVFSLFQLNPAPFCMLDEVDAPLDDSNTERFCDMVRRMSAQTQFIFISHNKITMELAQQLVGVTMQEQGVSRVVEVDMEEALRLREDAVA